MRIPFRIFAWTLVAAFAAGCTSTTVRPQPSPVPLAEGVDFDARGVVAALLARRGTTVQSVHGSWRERTFAAECVTKADEQGFTAVLLAPQVRLATIRLKPPGTVEFEPSLALPRAFEPEYALFDYALVNLPTPELRRALGRDFRVDEKGAVRTVSVHGRAVGVRTRLAGGDLHYENLALGYEYTVREIVP